MKFIKYLHYASILILLVAMVLTMSLDYGSLWIFILIPILINFILIIWAKALENDEDKRSFIYGFTVLIFIVITIISFLPTTIAVIAIPNLTRSIPTYYAKEKRIERRLNKLALRRFERFKKMKAPIKNGIWVERHSMQSMNDFDGTCIVPCVDGEIHGEVQILFFNGCEKIIYFNHGKIDSISYNGIDQVFSKTYRQKDNNYLEIDFNTHNHDRIRTDTSFISRENVERYFWQF